MRFELHQRVGRATQRRDGGHGRQFGKGFGVALGRWDGVVDTVTHLPGTQFFYGPILPDEPTYVTSAITTGDLWPTMAFFTGNAGDNGEGTMDVPFDSLAATKSGNRITNTPGYYDYGMASSPRRRAAASLLLRTLPARAQSAPSRAHCLTPLAHSAAPLPHPTRA